MTCQMQLWWLAMQVTGHLPFTPMPLAGRFHDHLFVQYFGAISQGNLEKSNSFGNRPDKQLVAYHSFAVNTRRSLVQLNVACILVRF